MTYGTDILGICHEDIPCSVWKLVGTDSSRLPQELLLPTSILTILPFIKCPPTLTTQRYPKYGPVRPCHLQLDPTNMPNSYYGPVRPCHVQLHTLHIHTGCYFGYGYAESFTTTLYTRQTIIMSLSHYIIDIISSSEYLL